MKFTKPPTWRIGSAKRKEISDYERFDYFKHKDRIPFIDRSVNLIKQTKWTHVPGGAMNLDNKVRYNLFLRIIKINLELLLQDLENTQLD